MDDEGKEEKLRPGKLDPGLLEELIRRCPLSDPRVVMGPGIGRDVAVLDMGDHLLVAKTDPITFAADEVGWYLVQVNANDIATAGARPRWLLVTLLLPEKNTTRGLVQRIHADLTRACSELGISLVGGHTEITHGLDRPILVGQMLGEVARDRLVRPEAARPGDVLLLTKGIAIEGTSILGRDLGEELARRTDEGLARACARFLHDPGITVVRDALAACEAGGVHAMHDPTEGGLATGLWEFSRVTGCGLEVRQDAVPVYPETRRACEAFGLDPWGLIASGALLIAADPAYEQAIRDLLSRTRPGPSSPGVGENALQAEGIPCTVIGRLLERGEPCRLITPEGPQDLPRFDRDEIARLFSSLAGG